MIYFISHSFIGLRNVCTSKFPAACRLNLLLPTHPKPCNIYMHPTLCWGRAWTYSYSTTKHTLFLLPISGTMLEKWEGLSFCTSFIHIYTHLPVTHSARICALRALSNVLHATAACHQCTRWFPAGWQHCSENAFLSSSLFLPFDRFVFHNLSRNTNKC